ncbi:MAG: hypothetical protein KF830_06750 [Planctomycetes bacterium]|nr:hypothetical protein [Planctomycetota bacterium]
MWTTDYRVRSDEFCPFTQASGTAWVKGWPFAQAVETHAAPSQKNTRFWTKST